MWVMHSLLGEGLGRGQTHQLIRQRYPKGGWGGQCVALFYEIGMTLFDDEQLNNKSDLFDQF